MFSAAILIGGNAGRIDGPDESARVTALHGAARSDATLP